MCPNVPRPGTTSHRCTRSLERWLRDIINFLPDATLVIDQKGQVIAWNKAIEEMTGIKAGEMIGKGDYEYAIPFMALVDLS